MSIKMKGLLKGLRYISQIFDAKEEDEEEEEEEMQIGLPTDVKHVAHIGWDGPSVTSPSWMTDFRSTPESASAAPLNSTGGEAKETSAEKSSSQECSNPSGGSVGFHESPARDLPDIPLPKPSRRRQSAGASSFDSTTQDAPLDTVPKQSSRRQKQSSSGHTMDSPGRDETSLEGVKASKKSSKEHREDSHCIPKQSRRKKTKGGSSSGGGSGSSKSRPETSSTTSTYTSPFSDPGTGSSSAALNKDSSESHCPTTAMSGLQLGEKGCDTSSVS